jgi:hypothetical protein
MHDIAGWQVVVLVERSEGSPGALPLLLLPLRFRAHEVERLIFEVTERSQYTG